MADELIEVRVPLTVMENGAWAAYAHSDDLTPNWDFMEDQCESYGHPKRYWITVYVKQHKAEGIEGSVTDAD